MFTSSVQRAGQLAKVLVASFGAGVGLVLRGETTPWRWATLRGLPDWDGCVHMRLPTGVTWTVLRMPGVPSGDGSIHLRLPDGSTWTATFESLGDRDWFTAARLPERAEYAA